MKEPYYDEDTVNLGYLNKVISGERDNLAEATKNVPKHYGSKPIPPYNAGDTWNSGGTVYVCIHSRTLGNYEDSDWTTESGALEQASYKSKTYLQQPTNYQLGDTWLLQSDTDHPEGKKGEILIANKNGKEYVEEDWVKQLSYVTHAEKVEIDEKIQTATNRIADIETSAGKIELRVQETEAKVNDTYSKAEIEAMNNDLVDDLDVVEKKISSLEVTSNNITSRVESVETDIAENISYSVSIDSSNGTVFKNGDIETILRAIVKKGNVDITDSFTDSQFSWERISEDSEGDKAWNNAHTHTKMVVVTSDDIKVRATFNVVLHIS